MNRVLSSKQSCANPNKSIIEQEKSRKNTLFQENYCYCLIWMLIGILSAGIVLATIVTLYLKNSSGSKTTTSNVIPTLRWTSTGITIAGLTNQSGTDSNKLHNPFGLYLDSSNTLYIADRFNNRIQKYAKDASSGVTVAGQASGSSGNGSDSLIMPTHVQVDSNGNIYVSDTSNNRIQRWTQGSSSGVTIAGKTGTFGSASDELNFPHGIVRHPISAGMFISDYSNHRVMYFSDGVLNGTLVAGGNGAGINNNQLSSPLGLYFHTDTNSLIIANHGASNIVRWTLGAANWVLVAGHLDGSGSSNSTGLSLPASVTLDTMGNVYVADMGNHRIQFFPNEEKNGRTIAGVTGMSGSTSSLLFNPISIVLDSQLNIYVSDYNNHRVQKFVRY